MNTTTTSGGARPAGVAVLEVDTPHGTATDLGAVAVLCLAFPVHPPGRPEKTRQPELDAVGLPTLVVQGASDPFGSPSAGSNRTVVTVPGNHGLSADLGAVAAAVRDWL